jgi:hypothetical protein
MVEINIYMKTTYGKELNKYKSIMVYKNNPRNCIILQKTIEVLPSKLMGDVSCLKFWDHKHVE